MHCILLYCTSKSCVSDNTTKEIYVLSLNLLYTMSDKTIKQRQHLRVAQPYIQHQKDVMCQTRKEIHQFLVTLCSYISERRYVIRRNKSVLSG
jgi:hypothetical protein